MQAKFVLSLLAIFCVSHQAFGMEAAKEVASGSEAIQVPKAGGPGCRRGAASDEVQGTAGGCRGCRCNKPPRPAVQNPAVAQVKVEEPAPKAEVVQPEGPKAEATTEPTK